MVSNCPPVPLEGFAPPGPEIVQEYEGWDVVIWLPFTLVVCPPAPMKTTSNGLLGFWKVGVQEMGTCPLWPLPGAPFPVEPIFSRSPVVVFIKLVAIEFKRE